MSIQATLRAASLLLLMVPLALLAQPADLLARAKSLIDARQPKEALALLEPETGRLAGNPDFDYLLGLAALDSGRPGIAVLALERALITRPNDPHVRAEIARAYFELGENNTAKQEFETVRRSGVPPEVAATIAKYLDAIGKREAGGTTVRGYLEGTAGSDSNINNATASAQIAIPAFGGALFSLNAAGQRRHGNFTSLGAGINLSSPLKPGLRLLAGANGSLRSNGSRDTFDTASLDASLGLAWEIDKRNLLSGTFQSQAFELDNRRFRSATGVSTQWQHTLSPDRQLSVFGQYSDLSYPGQDLRNADRTVLGAGYVQAFAGGWSPVAFATGFFGQEKERAQNVAVLGHRLQGARTGVTLKPADKLSVNASLSFESRHYGGQEPLFLTGRVDRQLDLRVALDFAVRGDLTVSPFFSYTDNASNIVINKFSRAVLGVTARMEF